MWQSVLRHSSHGSVKTESLTESRLMEIAIGRLALSKGHR